MKAVHSWMPYQYRVKSDNDNGKMWIRNDQRIHMNFAGKYFIANSTTWSSTEYDTFEEAEKAIGNDNSVEENTDTP